MIFRLVNWLSITFASGSKVVSQLENEQQRIVRLAHERGDIVAGDDGFYVYWPTRNTMGAVDAHQLRILADELDRMNAPWQAEIDKFFDSSETNLEKCQNKFDNGEGFQGFPPEPILSEEVSVCAAMLPRKDGRIGGSRHMCGKPYLHRGPHGNWKLVSQPEHARALQTHRMPKYNL
jgi:hypothetical protein